MAKRETKETYKDTKQQSAENTARYNEARGESGERIGGMESPIEEQKTALTGGYQGMAGGMNAGSINPRSITAASIGQPRAINVNELRGSLAGQKEFGQTGGFTPERSASIMQNVQGLKDIGQTGGISDENVNRMRGMGGYDEFAKTGGYTPESIANIKAQALSPISSYATGTRDELSRRAALTGGYTPGFDSANRALQRDTARGIADTSLAANVGIQDRINQGRQWGIGGMAGAEQGIAGMQSGNKLAGLQGAGQMELGLQNSISQYRAQGMSMEQATAKALSDFDAMNVGNEMQASMFNAGMLDSANRFNAGMGTEADIFNIQNRQNQQAQGMSGLQGLYNTDIGQYQNELDRRNALLGGQSQSNLGYLGQQGQLAVQPGMGGNIMAGIGAGAGLASNMFMPGMPRNAGPVNQGISEQMRLNPGNMGTSNQQGAWYR
jgi:hypothetical protein